MAKYMSKKDVVSYIRKEAAEAQSAFEELGGESGVIAEAFEDLANELEDFPTADVAPVIHGKPVTKIRTVTLTDYHEEIGILSGDRANLYRKKMTHADIPYDHCPVCGATLCSRWHNYCGKCGARMDGAE